LPPKPPRQRKLQQLHKFLLVLPLKQRQFKPQQLQVEELRAKPEAACLFS
jgi:hypothetical protein